MNVPVAGVRTNDKGQGVADPDAECGMETVYDWVTVGMFAVLIVLLLHRSSMEEPPDSLWAYLPPAAGCALGNQLGNADEHAMAIIVLAGVVVYFFLVLKPQFRW